jgi:multicomponent Na+:H+ antiporter subunit D
MAMTEQIVIGPMLAALGSIVLTLSTRRFRRLQRAVSVAGGLAYAGAVGALAWRVALGAGPAAYQVGGVDAPFGITLVADELSAFMLVIAGAVGAASIAFSAAYVDPDNQAVFYHPLFHCLLLGVAGSFLTGDLFNLFVWFEVMLMASYVFVAFYGGEQHTAAALRYLVLNVFGGALLLLGVGGLYAVTGTLNMGDMARRLAAPAAYGIDVDPVLGLSALLFAAFALKAGLVPFQFWVPGAYRAAPLPVVAMLAGVTKKVGVYAIVRLYFTVLGGLPVRVDVLGVTGDSALALLGPVLLLTGIASIVLGGLGAVVRDTFEETFAYSSIGQVGFIVVPVGVAAMADAEPLRRFAIAAALVYALHHALAKGLLFLATGAVRSATGTNRLADLGGLAGRSPSLGATFFVGSLSLVGIPPLTGFFGKFLVFDAAVRRAAATGTAGAAGVVVALLVGAVLTILYTSRTWTRCFWGARTPPVEDAAVDPAQVAVLVAVATTIVVLGVGFDPVFEFADAAAGAALDREGYVDMIDPVGGVEE